MIVSLTVASGYSVVLRTEQVSYLKEGMGIEFENPVYPPNRQMQITLYQNADTSIEFDLKTPPSDAALDLTGATVVANFIELIPVRIVRLSKALSLSSPLADGKAVLAITPAEAWFSGGGDLELVMTKAGKKYKLLPRLEYRVLPSSV